MKLGRIQIDRKFAFSVVVGIMMITWAMGLALSYNIDVSGNEMKIESVYQEKLTGEQKVAILKTGKVLIEYLYLDNPDALQKKAVYENFVGQYPDFAVLETVAVGSQNGTMDQMITPSGDVVSLDNVTAANLLDVFCDKNTGGLQPRECILRDI